MEFEFTQDLRTRISENFTRFERRPISNGDLRAAAVAIVLLSAEESEHACFVLTRRSSALRHHRSQYALPGGRLEHGEDAQSAALREIEEEIGIGITSESVLGRLDDFATRSGFCITPVVVWAGDDPRIAPDPNEVEAVFRIPLWDLNRPDIPRLDDSAGTEHPVLSAPFQTLGHEVFAPTAAILYQFREVGLRGQATRVAHFEQPKFAWK